jgi:hypothetical protein
LPSGVPSSRVVCVDGDPACDADNVAGRCTFRLGVCLNNEDTRLACSPGAITSVRLKGGQAFSSGGQAILAAVRGLGSTYPFAKGRGVAFPDALITEDVCTAYGDFVVPRRGRVGRAKLTVVVGTEASGKDVSRVKLVCMATP